MCKLRLVGLVVDGSLMAGTSALLRAPSAATQYATTVLRPCQSNDAATVIIPNMTLSISQQARHRGEAAAAAAAAVGAVSVAHPQQLFQELRQYSRLLSRKGLAAALEAEFLALAKQVR